MTSCMSPHYTQSSEYSDFDAVRPTVFVHGLQGLEAVNSAVCTTATVTDVSEERIVKMGAISSNIQVRCIAVTSTR